MQEAVLAFVAAAVGFVLAAIEVARSRAQALIPWAVAAVAAAAAWLAALKF